MITSDLWHDFNILLANKIIWLIIFSSLAAYICYKKIKYTIKHINKKNNKQYASTKYFNAMIVIILTCTVSYAINNFILKPSIKRTRPCNELINNNDNNRNNDNKKIISNEKFPKNAYDYSNFYAPLGCKESYSMPSNHGSFFSSLAACSYLLGYGMLSLVFAICAVFVSFSRIFLGLHYPFDIFISWIFGIAISTFMVNAIKLLISKLQLKIIL